MPVTFPAVEDWETGADAANVTTGNSFCDAVTGTVPTYRTAEHKHGSKAVRFQTSAATSICEIQFSATGIAAITSFIKITATGTLIQALNAFNGATKLGDVRIDTDGTIELRDNNTHRNQTTHALTPNQWARICWIVNPAANTFSLRLYDGVDVDNPIGTFTEQITGTMSINGQSQITFFRMGIIGSATYTIYHDYTQIATAEQPSPDESGGGGGGGPTPNDYFEDFEGGANGATITTGNSIFSTASGGATFSTAQSKSGTRSGHVDNTGSAGNFFLNRTFSARPLEWASVYFRFTAIGTQINFLNSYNGGTKIGGVRLNAAGRLILQDNNNTIATSTAAITVNTWQRIAYLCDPAHNVQKLRLYLNADVDNPQGSPTQELTATASVSGQNLIDEFRLGFITPVAMEVFFDYYQLNTDEPIPIGGTGGSTGAAIVPAPSMKISLVMTPADIGNGIVVTAPIIPITVVTPVPSLHGGSTVLQPAIVAADPIPVTVSMPSPGLFGDLPPVIFTTPQTGKSGFRSNSPIEDVIKAITSPSTRVTRRMAIYEADGETLWTDLENQDRLIDGTVTIDYSRAERRALDCLLDNKDGKLKHDPNGFWYDKVIKIWRGVEYTDTAIYPRILIIQDAMGKMRGFLRNTLGYPLVDINTGATTVEDLYGYDIIVADSGTGVTTKAALLKSAYQAGYRIFTTGLGNGVGEIPYVVSEIAKTTGTWQADPPPFDSPLAGGWGSVTFTGNTSAGALPTALDASAFIVATFTYSATTTVVASVATNSSGGRWFDYHPNTPWTNPNVGILIRKGVDWLFNYVTTKRYETQLGEFYIDRIEEARFPHHIKVTARDATKKFLLSKFPQALSFPAGMSLDVLINALAANSGVTKTLLDTNGAVLTADIAFDRTTERWKALSDICAAANLEVFVNASGFLVTRPYYDPITSPTAMTFLTGKQGNLADYNKASNDSRIYNHVVVSSESADSLSSGDLFYAEVQNTDPQSPTRIARLGDRTYFYTSSFFTNQQQCVDYATSLLRIVALEEFELSFSSLVFPWIEVGEIIEFTDPRAGVGAPDRFLLDTLSIPLKLGPMTGTGKRVTIVGDSG